MAKKFVRKIKIRKSDQRCFFCVEKKEADYKEPGVVGKYVTDRGKIVPRVRSGICQKHQRRLAKAIKRARHLALLPFTPQI